MLNKVMLIGRLGKAPDVRYTPDGTMVTNFSIATDETWKDKQSGEKKQKTEWHKIQTWGKLAEICGNYLTKGSMVYIEGKLQTRSWEDKEGVKRYVTEIIGSQLKMLGGGERKEQNAGGDFENRGEFNPDEVRAADGASLDDVLF